MHEPNGFSLELIHGDSPESPFYPGKLTDSERISRLVESSIIRAQVLSSYLKYNSTSGPEAYRFPVYIWIASCVASTDVLEPTNNSRILFNFGCSKDNRNFSAFSRTGKTDGIMGLNMSPVSILQQLRNVTNQRFSYCLTPYGSRPPATSLLRFGNDISTWGRGFYSTPFVDPPDMPNYFLNLLDLSVAGQRLRLPPETFALKRDGTGGTIIDSGTGLTLVVQPAYRHLLGALQNHFDHHGFHRVHIPDTNLELRYNFAQNRTFQNHASLTYHFQGADFTVEPRYAYVVYNDENAFCVALLASHIEGRAIIGALHQANTRFVYNAAKRRLKFKAENFQNDKR
ncbi:Aspartic proteinase nepenthesin-1 precursor, putative [Ricinus communis]|uniref:Aspartic proteinase nepenthesin-1, putative n=1 Tax=Ricinus communis TaxID=3988 RepID=B9SA51_RICCO|nr:Aspartic proteinase nepenthesin-1 precursor, putative [Ricinus communis]